MRIRDRLEGELALGVVMAALPIIGFLTLIALGRLLD